MNVALVILGSQMENAAPPLGLLYISSVLKKNGHQVRFYDASFTKGDLAAFDNFLKGLEQEGFVPDFVGFSLFTVFILKAYQFIKHVKAVFPETKVVVGGPHATALPERTMEERPEIDYLVFGEGEITFLELMECPDPTEAKNILGLYSRKEGRIVFGGPRPLIKNLDEIPFPDFDLCQGYPYQQYDGLTVGRFNLPIMTARGCPWNCSFCFKAALGKSFRRRSVQNVVDEIERLMKKYGADDFFFEDDLFTLQRKWLDAFYAELKKRAIKISWKCQSRVDTLKAEDYRAMKENGGYWVIFGVEAGNEQVLRDIEKKITKEQVVKAHRMAKEAGLNVASNYIFGHRLDNRATVEETVELALAADPDIAHFFVLSPIPGSAAFQEVPEELKYDWELHHSYLDRLNRPISISSLSPDELLGVVEYANGKFYGRSRYLWRQLIFCPNKQERFMRVKVQLWETYRKRNLLNRIMLFWFKRRYF